MSSRRKEPEPATSEAAGIVEGIVKEVVTAPGNPVIVASAFDPFTPEPFYFNPDDKRAYLLMVFSRQPFVAFAIGSVSTEWKRNTVYPKATGVYALYLSDRPLSELLKADELTKPLTARALSRIKGNLSLVYVGKTSSGGTVHSRLRTHFTKISKRQNVSVDRIVIRFMQIPENWNVLFAEETLIKQFEPPWNGNGFGSNAPGGGRLGKRLPGVKHFNTLYPLKPGEAADPDEEDTED